MAFFHIPLPETHELYKELWAANPAHAAICFGEPITGFGPNYGMFDKMKELQSTTHIFFGHDHVNVLDSEYQGIRFVYGLKSSMCSYFDKKKIGTTLITIKDNIDTGKLNIIIDFNYY